MDDIRQTTSKQFIYIRDILVDLKEVVALREPMLIDTPGASKESVISLFIRGSQHPVYIRRYLIEGDEIRIENLYRGIILLDDNKQPIWYKKEMRLFNIIRDQWMEIKND